VHWSLAHLRATSEALVFIPLSQSATGSDDVAKITKVYNVNIQLDGTVTT